jgi:hypothetical protein
MSNNNIWVICDGFGVQIFFTREERFANFNNMSDSEYNKDKCSISLNVPSFDGSGYSACEKNMDTGEITIIERDRKYQPVYPHIPAQ